MALEITRRLFDVDDYHRMAEAGILSEDDRVELIDGEIIAMTPVGPRHNAAVDRATRALVTAVGDRAIVRVQGSIRLGRHDEPQPDFVLLKPKADFYATHLPAPEDVLLVIEVAESSLDYDREVKVRLYAGARIREYWLVDLERRTVSCHLHPHNGAYQDVRQVGAEARRVPDALPGCAIAMQDLLAD